MPATSAVVSRRPVSSRAARSRATRTRDLPQISGAQTPCSAEGLRAERACGRACGTANRLGLFTGLLLGRLLVVAAKLHLAKDAFALHLLLQRLERLIDIVVADQNLHAFLSHQVCTRCQAHPVLDLVQCDSEAKPDCARIRSPSARGAAVCAGSLKITKPHEYPAAPLSRR